MKIIRGLTLWRPWSWAICHAGKRVENRDWHPSLRLRGSYLAIHGGRHYDAAAAEDIAEEFGVEVPPAPMCPQGIVAVCRLAGWWSENADLPGECPLPPGQDRWYGGGIGWVLDNVVVIDPVPCRGAQGLWQLPDDVLAKIRERYSQAKGGSR